MSTKKTILLLFVGAPLFALCLISLQVYYQIELKSYTGETKYFTVNPGEGFSRINYRLKQENFISNTTLFHKYAKINGVVNKFKAGSYEIKTGSNLREVMNTLVYGAPYTTQITVAEGKNLFEIATILEKKEIVTAEKFIDAAKDETFTMSLGIPSSRVEGYLYPETYRFRPNTPAKEIITLMVQTFKDKTKELNFADAKNLSAHEIITLASIVEKETGASFERATIAGVFLNRLEKGMRLQSDPTTIYGFYEQYKGNLKQKDLQTKTPYNTYKVSGLPVGPISNPGIESIKATLSPETHDYLYFVSQNDGTHIFTKSYKDHISAVQKFQVSREYRKNRSWRDLGKNVAR